MHHVPFNCTKMYHRRKLLSYQCGTSSIFIIVIQFILKGSCTLNIKSVTDSSKHVQTPDISIKVCYIIHQKFISCTKELLDYPLNSKIDTLFFSLVLLIFFIPTQVNPSPKSPTVIPVSITRICKNSCQYSHELSIFWPLPSCLGTAQMITDVLHTTVIRHFGGQGLII